MIRPYYSGRRGSYLKRHKKVRILPRVGVADGRIVRAIRCNNPKPDNVVCTQSMSISQEGITATQEPSRDSDLRVPANYTQLTIFLSATEKIVDVLPGDTCPNVQSLCVLIIYELVKLFQRNEDPDWRINLRNWDMTPTLDLWVPSEGYLRYDEQGGLHTANACFPNLRRDTWIRQKLLGPWLRESKIAYEHNQVNFRTWFQDVRCDFFYTVLEMVFY